MFIMVKMSYRKYLMAVVASNTISCDRLVFLMKDIISNSLYTCKFQVSPSYPHEPPKVKCKTKVYHPNIDLEGNVCLNILREDWKPVLNINTIIYGLNLLFTQPNDEDPLNPNAAAVLRDNPRLFESNVRKAMAGGYVNEIDIFPLMYVIMQGWRVRLTNL